MAPPLWTGCGPPGLDSFASIFIYSKNNLRLFSGHSENFYFCTKITPWQLLKTASVRVSSIQITQVRVQNKGKSVWKSRYDGDVSARPPTSWPPPLCLDVGSKSPGSCSVRKSRSRKFHSVWTSFDIPFLRNPKIGKNSNSGLASG